MSQQINDKNNAKQAVKEQTLLLAKAIPFLITVSQYPLFLPIFVYPIMRRTLEKKHKKMQEALLPHHNQIALDAIYPTLTKTFSRYSRDLNITPDIVALPTLMEVAYAADKTVFFNPNTSKLTYRLSDTDAEDIIAHELVHIKNKDIEKLYDIHAIDLASSFSLVALPLMIATSSASITATLISSTLVIANHFYQKLSTAHISRTIESRTDKQAVALTQRHDCLIRALTKLENMTAAQEMDTEEQAKSMKQMLFTPLPIFDKYLATHPDTEKRIKAIKKEAKRLKLD